MAKDTQEQEKVTQVIDDDVDSVSLSKEGDTKPAKGGKSASSVGKTVAISGGVFLLLAILGGIAYAVLSKGEEKKVRIADQIINQIDQKKEPETRSKLRDMVKQADSLYKQGRLDEALNLYNKIGKYESFLTSHNLGVTAMKEKKYDDALKHFQESIQSNENQCVSAINAAVVSLHLGKKELFDHYLTLAQKYLPAASKDPLYDYYYSLIMYYKKKYVESLSVLQNKKIEFYEDSQYKIAAAMLTGLNDYTNSINYLEKQKDLDSLSLGLLYSKVGEYASAIPHLINAQASNKKHDYASMALYMNYLKSGKMISAAKELAAIHKKYGNAISPQFPVELYLKHSLFNVAEAQKEYRKKFDYPEDLAYKLFLYFAPYRIFNANQVINYIRKGAKSFYIDDVTYAKEDLTHSRDLTRLNLEMTQGIKLATNYKIRSANEIFAKLSSNYKFDSMLEYNLALTYAQLGNYGLAYEHFTRSYSLDNTNKLSAIASVMSQRLARLGDGEDLINTLSDKLNQGDDDPQNEFYESLISYLRGIYSDRYLGITEEDRSVLNVFHKVVLANVSGEFEAEKEHANELNSLLGDNIVAGILQFFAHNRGQPRRNLAQNAINFMKNNRSFLDILYYGPIIAKELYIGMANISGTTYEIRDILRDRLIIEKHDVRGVIQALALVDIYLNFFEESFTLYNTLIDDFKEDDPMTLFFASVAAIGAGKKANAIALLELVALNQSTVNPEARFALAMLYQESNNLAATNNHLEVINSEDFRSEYFDFKVRKKDVIQ